MKYLLYLLVFSSVNGFTQEIECPDFQSKNTLIAVPVVSPEFPGGVRKMAEFIQENFNYPSVEIANKIQGTIWVSCVIEIDGSLTYVKIEKGLSNIFDKEAIRVIHLMPKWKPGEDQDGNIKGMKYYIPIKIK